MTDRVTDRATPSANATAGFLAASSKPLAEAYDVGLVDLDGVVYLGPDPIPGAADAIAKAREVGMRVTFVTNNASRTPSAVADHLRSLGIPARSGDVVTSAQAAVRLLTDKLGTRAAVLIVGGQGLHEAADDAGLRVVDSADDGPDAVVQGFTFDTTYADLAEAALAIRHGALWIASNGDVTLPSPRGLLPGNGSLVALLAAATGRHPEFAGKPELPLHAEAVERTGAVRPLVVGDRLDTDIEGAVAAGTDSLLVLTGVTRVAELLQAPPDRRPTYVAADLGGLLVAHPQVRFESGTARCGSWTASASDGVHELRLTGGGDPIDGLRAALAAAWASERASDIASDIAEQLDLD